MVRIFLFCSSGGLRLPDWRSVALSCRASSLAVRVSPLRASIVPSLRFKIGDAVIYTNDFGAQFHSRVTGFYQPAGPCGLYALGRRYFLDSSSPWMPVAESSLRPDDAA